MRQAALLAAVVCVLAAPLAGAVAATDGALQPATRDGQPVTQAGRPVMQAGQPALQDEGPAKEGVHITVQLQPDGDARWNISAVYAIETEQDAAAFAALANDFKARRTDNGFSVDVFRAVVPAVSERVGRPMAIQGAGRTATTIEYANNSTGVLSLQFTWTNFSEVNNETMVVDSFSGSWFGDLGPDQTLTIRPPAGYDTNTVDPQTSVVNGAYRWEGPQEFGEGHPSLVFTEVADNPSADFGFSMVLVVGVGGVALLLGGLFAWMYTRDGSVPVGLPGGGADSEADGSGDAAETEAAEQSASQASSAGGSAGAAGGSESESVDPELLSDEERVERLLREHGGRMKQSKIVEETRWSTAKVSQLLSSMDDEDRIEKLRIGRENLISLPGEGVDEE
ncbi:MAG: helix-turn-helix transcriptional regulator [Halobacterium sp.]